MRTLCMAGALALAVMALAGCHGDGRPGYDGDHHHRDHPHRGDHDRDRS